MSQSHKGTVLITGGAKRIGASIAISLATIGYDIALHYNSSRKEASRVQKEIEGYDRNCSLFPCDLANANEAMNLIRAVYKKHSNLNTLINSASVFFKSSLFTNSLKEFNQNFDINFKAPYILSAEFARICKKGNIINFLDTNVVKNKTTHIDYLLSKKTLFELTKLSALHLAPNIRVNAIAPGLILPPEGKDNNYLNRLANNIPMKKKGSLQNISQSVRFILENDFMTGQVLFNDGGEHLV